MLADHVADDRNCCAWIDAEVRAEERLGHGRKSRSIDVQGRAGILIHEDQHTTHDKRVRRVVVSERGRCHVPDQHILRETEIDAAAQGFNVRDVVLASQIIDINMAVRDNRRAGRGWIAPIATRRKLAVVEREAAGLGADSDVAQEVRRKLSWRMGEKRVTSNEEDIVFDRLRGLR